MNTKSVLIDIIAFLPRSIIDCPFHEGDEKNCVVDFQTSSWHCFGCGQTGSIEITAGLKVKFKKPKS